METVQKRKRKLDPKIIRIGDQVKIINPIFVERVGYPLSFSDGCEKVEELYKDKIISFLKDVFPESKHSVGSFNFRVETNWDNTVVYSKVVKAINYYYMQQVGFGGNERKLFLVERDCFKSDVMYVAEIGIVKTGTYYPSSVSYDYSGEWDCEPGGLDNMRTHKILQLTRFKDWILPFTYKLERVKLDYSALCIEARNVEKIFKENK